MVNDVCYVHYLDCRGYYDFAAEIANVLLTAFTITLAIRNCKVLTQQQWRSSQEQIEASRKRKIKVNIFLIVVTSILMVEIVYGIASFFAIGNVKKVGKPGRGVSLGYKIIEICCVLSYNGLISFVGFLYWRALRVFYQARSQNTFLGGGTSLISKQIPKIYRKQCKWIFYCLYLYNIACFIASAIILIVIDASFLKKHFVIINIIGFTATAMSILTFFFARWNYYRQLLKSVQMRKEQLRKESIFSLLIVLACAVRLALDMGHVFFQDFQDNFRHYDNVCHDVRPYHALYIFFLTVINNVVPGLVFTHIFKAVSNTQTFKSQSSSFF